MLKNLLIADDHLMFGSAMQYMLKQYDPEIETISVGSVEEAECVLEDNKSIDLVLLDYAMPAVDGITGLLRIKQKNPEQRIAIISGVDNARLAKKSLDAGAIGWLPKTLSEKPLLHALRLMAAGETFVPVSVFEEMANRKSNSSILTPTEIDVAEKLIDGLSDKEIASELGCEPKTVQVHVRNLYQKTGTSNRVTFTNKYRDQY